MTPPSMVITVFVWFFLFLKLPSPSTSRPLNFYSSDKNLFEENGTVADSPRTLWLAVEDVPDDNASASLFAVEDPDGTIGFANATKVVDEFKGWGGALRMVGRGANAFGKGMMKTARATGKWLAKNGPKAWKGVQKYAGKVFRATMEVAQQALVLAPQGMDLYYKYADNQDYRTGDRVEDSEDEPIDEDGEYRPEIPEREDESKFLFDKQSGKVFGLPYWVIGVIVVLVLVLGGGVCAWCFLGGKADYRHRRNMRHKRRLQRGGRRSDSDSDTSESSEESETQTQTQMTTLATEVPTITEATQTSMATTTAASTVAGSARKGPTKGKGKKKRGIRKALDNIERSLYAPRRKGTKGKKKKLLQSTMTQTTATTMATTTAATSQVTEAKTTSDSELESKAKTAKEKSKTASKSESKSTGKKCAVKRSKTKKKTAKQK